MIVISQALALAVEAAVLGAPVFGWQNLITISTITASSADADHPASNLANEATFNFWRAAPTSPPAGSDTLTWSGAPAEVDYVGIAGHNLGTAQITAKVEVLDLDTSPPSWVEAVEESLPADDKPLILRFVPVTTTGVRVVLTGGAAPAEIAVLYVGKLLAAQRGTSVDHVPIPFGRQTQKTAGVSQSGNYLGTIITGEGRATTFSIANIDAYWFREIFDPFLKIAQARPFFFAWRPVAWPTDVGYCWLTADPQPPVAFATGRVSVDLPLAGIAP